MSKKDRKSKPHFRIQGLERRVLMSATWVDTSDLNADPTSNSLEDLAESSSINAASEFPLDLASADLQSPNASPFLRFDRLTSEEVAELSNPPHLVFEPLSQIDLETDSDISNQLVFSSELTNTEVPSTELPGSLHQAIQKLEETQEDTGSTHNTAAFTILTAPDLASTQNGESDTASLLRIKASTGELLAFDDNAYIVAGVDHLLRVDFVGASSVDPVQQVALTDSLLDTTSNSYQNVYYANLWNGIDAVIESDATTLLKSTYYVDAGVSVDQIHLQYNQELSLDEHGNLVMHFERGTMTESAPVAWQDIEGVRYYIEVEFRLIDDNEVGFVVGDYNHAYQLVIDPTLTWNSFVGGTGTDEVNDIGLDSSGNVYVTGYSTATWGSPMRGYSSGNDAFVAKYNGSGALQWSTFLGGAGTDSGNNLSVDSSGNVFVAGHSSATWGTPVTAFSGGTYDAFLAKVNTSGALQWNTFTGGSGLDTAKGVALDSSGNVYLTGYSGASWGTPVRAFMAGGSDGFAAKFSSAGSLTWNTFLGGAGSDVSQDIFVDSSNNVYGAGYSTATWGTPKFKAMGTSGIGPPPIWSIDRKVGT